MSNNLVEDKILDPDPIFTEIASVDYWRKWHRGRRKFIVWMYRIESHQSISHLMEILWREFPIVPIQNLHITVFVSGFLVDHVQADDELSFECLQKQISIIDNLKLTHPVIQADRPVFDQYGIYIPTVDETENTKIIRSELKQSKEELRISDYFPHITIGHYLTRNSLKEMAFFMRNSVSLPSKFKVESLDLVQIDTEFPIAPGVGLCNDNYIVLKSYTLHDLLEGLDGRIDSVNSRCMS